MTASPKQEAEALWQQACQYLQAESGLSPAGFNNWIAPLLPLSLNACFIELGVPNPFFGDFLDQNMGHLIADSLVRVSGRTDFTYRITVVEIQAQEHTASVTEVKLQAVSASAERSEEEEDAPEIAMPEGCDPTYIFDNFVVGEENKIAYYAARKAAEKPGMAYNPLFIFGGTSLGKTHLLQAIANEYCHLHKRSVAKYVTCEQMMNDYISAINERTLHEFHARYRGVDILLVDDVQFLGNKENLQEVFFNTFNTLHHDRRQIVLTSDRAPAQINGLADRLVSRFESGLIAEVIPPSYETRLAVVRKYREMYGSRVCDDVLEFLARRITANMRRLKGAMIRISAYETVHHGEPPNVAAVELMLASLLATERSSKRLAIEEIQRKVSEYYDIRLQDMLGSRRTKQLAGPRQVAMYLARKLTDFSYPDIASAFGGKNHATIIHACKKIEAEIELDSDLRVAVTLLERRLKD